MEMKSPAPYAPPPPYGETMYQSQPQPSSYFYSPPYPATSWAPNHPIPHTTTEIGFVEVNAIRHTAEPPTVVHVVHDPGWWNQHISRRRCCLSTFISLISALLIIIILMKVIFHLL